jgi:ribosomal protein S8
LLPDSEARKRKLGGELICEVWSWVESVISQ